MVRAAVRSRKKRDNWRRKVLYRRLRVTLTRACFFATVNGDAMPRWASGDDIRFCAYARIRIAFVPVARFPPSLLSSPSIFSSSSLSFLPFLFFFFLLLLFFFFPVRCPLESIPLDSFLTLAVGRPIATSADSALLRIPTRIPDLLHRAKGEGAGEGRAGLKPVKWN